MIEHAIGLDAPFRRSVQVELRCELPPGSESQDFAFPVWTPGSYLVREHERHIHDVRAYADDREVPATKVEKNRWRVPVSGARTLRVTYEVYAHELTVRTSHVDGSHAFLNPVTLCAWLPGREAEAQRLILRDLPPGWGAACALEEPEPNVFVAADYDELVDSPLECGPHALPAARHAFEVRGVRHEIVLWGASSLDAKKLCADAAAIAEAQASVFGGLPYPRYLFIVHASDSGRGGLEHRASSALLFSRSQLHKPNGYEELLSLLSHELFHAWNVKRIKPAAFTPYDLGRENYTRSLWAFEGLTSYYEDLFLVRAGHMSRARFLEQLGERLTSLERTPGRLRLSVEEASYDAWIRLYRPDENSANSSASYYLKGSLVGLLLDLEIRRRTAGARSLDDVMRLLWREHGHGPGVEEDGVERACERVAGASLTELFDIALRGTGELPLESPLAAHGLHLLRRVAKDADDRGGTPPAGTPLRSDIGLLLRTGGRRVLVASVRLGSPAEQVDVAPGDQVVAIDGLRAETSTAHARLHDRAPGSPARLTLFRRDELIERTVVAAPPMEDTLYLAEDPAASPEAKALLQTWLGT